MPTTATPDPWRQAYVTIAPWDGVERVAAAYLAPIMAGAEAAGMINSWFFIRKRPAIRLRYLPAPGSEHRTEDLVGIGLDELADAGTITGWTSPVYEPEHRAFGGEQAMDIAHALFHADSHHLLHHLADPDAVLPPGTRRTLAVLLCAHLLRSVGLDWHEQGDVWARVAEQRTLPANADPDKLRTMQTNLHALLSVDIKTLIRNKPSLPITADWSAAFSTAGAALATLNTAGQLDRGLRDVAAKHVVFTWNRHGISAAVQAVLAHCATAAVFGPDPAQCVEPASA